MRAPQWLLLAAGFVALQVAALALMGHPVLCACGTVKLWHGLVSSPETSKHWLVWKLVVIRRVVSVARMLIAKPQLRIGRRGLRDS